MYITEIVRVKTIDGISNEDFLTIVDGLERNFHSVQPGFIDTELLFDDKNNEWCMIQHWKSKEDLKNASNRIFTDPAAEEYIHALDKQSVKMLILPQFKTWTERG